MQTKPNVRIDPLSILGVVLVAGALIGLTWLGFSFATRRAALAETTPQYNITLIAAPTQTHTPSVPTPLPTPTAGAPVVLPEGVIGINAYVQVTGTQGLGLRVRDRAGTGADVNFLAMDDEIFKVIGGPVVSDGYTWWQLEAPLDSTRVGWAVEDFLSVFSLSTPTP